MKRSTLFTGSLTSIAFLLLIGCGSGSSDETNAKLDDPSAATVQTPELNLGSDGNEHVTVHILPEVDGVVAGESFQIGILLDVIPAWHVYWTNPGQTGLPTEVSLTMPEGFTVGEAMYPVPKRFIEPGDIEGTGYEDQVMLLVPVTAASELSGAEIEFEVTVGWLACKEACVPGEVTIAASLPVVEAAKKVNTAHFRQWMPTIPVEPFPAEVSVDASGERPVIRLDWAEPVAVKDIFYAADPSFEAETVNLEHADRITEFSYRLNTFPGVQRASDELQITIAYTTPEGDYRGGVVTVPLD